MLEEGGRLCEEVLEGGWDAIGDGETIAHGWDDEMQQTWDQFVALISAYLRGEHGFTARRAMERLLGVGIYRGIERIFVRESTVEVAVRANVAAASAGPPGFPAAGSTDTR